MIGGYRIFEFLTGDILTDNITNNEGVKAKNKEDVAYAIDECQKPPFISVIIDGKKVTRPMVAHETRQLAGVGFAIGFNTSAGKTNYTIYKT